VEDRDVDQAFLHGRARVQIERVYPEIDGGRFPVKRVLGDRVEVTADLFTDGHDVLTGVLLYRPAPSPRDPDPPWLSSTLSKAEQPDRFRAFFTPTSLGFYHYTIEGFIDRFGTFQRDLRKRLEAGQDVALDLLDGAPLLLDAASRAEGDDARAFCEIAARLVDEKLPLATRIDLALDPGLHAAALRHPDHRQKARYPGVLEVMVEPERARFSSWYEFFPRSFGPPGRHGTFADATSLLPYVAAMGFDVLYLPPIHPIGVTNRKGKNGALVAAPGDPGSPWAIGSLSGGHKAVHPDLGTLDDFDRFLEEAKRQGLDVALDLAFQASPDHPWVKEHPEWFFRRADGSLRYAENPPKKYQDIHAFDFEAETADELWDALLDVVLFWIGRGVRFFRVDNPHTKPLPFWEWLIRRVKLAHPDVIFLSEAFTRPAVAYGLAKRGFSQSYTYFTWRVAKDEIKAYLHELTRTELREYFRPNFWPNTPDLLPDHLQTGGRAAFVLRAVLAATLCSNFGVYGPAFELMDATPKPGAEEYAQSEKFELKSWNLDHPDSLRHVLARLNRLRLENPALQKNDSIRFFPTNHDFILCSGKTEGDNAIVVALNLDPHQAHAATIELDVPGFTDEARTFEVEEQLSFARYSWKGNKALVEIDPRTQVAMIFKVARLSRKENEFEYWI